MLDAGNQLEENPPEKKPIKVAKTNMMLSLFAIRRIEKIDIVDMTKEIPITILKLIRSQRNPVVIWPTTAAMFITTSD
jgi:hypothetical protein